MMRLTYILVLLLIVQFTFSQEKLKNLEVFTAGYPRAFIFWQNVRDLVNNPNLSTTALDNELMKLNGICSPSAYWPKIIDFKKRHPEKLTYLFVQGSVVAEKPGQYDPFERTDFYDGHWVYFEGCLINGNVSTFQTEIPVKTIGSFKVGEDVALCATLVNGKPNWDVCEQVVCTAVNTTNNTITVKRAQYGSTALSFELNKGFASAHAYWDWGSPDPKGDAISWTINFSTTCPKDKNGKTIADLMFEKITTYFLPGGELESYDGVEFDLCYSNPTSTNTFARKFDTNGDGLGDGGVFNGKNEFGIGLFYYHERLRNTLGSDKLIMGDSGEKKHQRSYGILNGTESEWWPKWDDNDITYWSEGINLRNFWKQNAFTPSLSYMVHKVGGNSRTEALKVPFNIHRSVFAAAQFTDVVLTTFFNAMPVLEPGNLYTVWDEYVKGTEKKRNWLGQPIAPAVRIATQQNDLLQGAGQDISTGFLIKFQGSGLSFTPDNKAVKISAIAGTSLKFSIGNIPCNGPDLFISFSIRGDGMKGYPLEYAREMIIRPTSGTPDQDVYFNSHSFTTALSFRGIIGSSINLNFEIEGIETVWISDFKVFAHPDATYRDFENGFVLANPSDHTYEFDLRKIASGMKFKRLQATYLQDTKTNNGAAVGDIVTLGARDALFLIKTNPGTGISEDKYKKDIDIYPIPCTDFITISNLETDRSINYEIHSIEGKLVKSGIISSVNNQISTPFANGVYIISFQNNEQQVRLKFIKQ
jgi:hypothetical protein